MESSSLPILIYQYTYKYMYNICKYLYLYLYLYDETRNGDPVPHSRERRGSAIAFLVVTWLPHCGVGPCGNQFDAGGRSGKCSAVMGKWLAGVTN